MDQTIKVGVGAIIIKDNKILLTKRKVSLGSGSYGTVGGHLEYGETPIEGIKRETLEEPGVTLKNIQFLVCSNIIKYGKHYINITFTAEIDSGEPAIMEPETLESVGWYDLDSLPSPLFEPVAISLKALKTKQNYFEIDEN